jgi:NAD(P)-dependent dehydrogenase (short-subunit alcohol dehydrogenase family)
MRDVLLTEASSGARGLGYNMLEGMILAGCSGAAILDVLEDEGKAAAANLSALYGITVIFYKVDITEDLDVENVFVEVC